MIRCTFDERCILSKVGYPVRSIINRLRPWHDGRSTGEMSKVARRVRPIGMSAVATS